MAERQAAWMIFSLLLLVGSSAGVHGENWPGWRGPRGDGTSLEKGIPIHWDGKTGRNIAWKVPLDISGHSSPIVWENRVFVVGCQEKKENRVLVCLDRKTGKTIWRTVVLHAPLEKKHSLNSYASGTPATDGKLVYLALLEPDFGSRQSRTPGNMVVAAYDLRGKRRWLVRPGRFASSHGFCTSPVLYEDKVIVNGDHDGESYIIALDRLTGETLWKVPRKNKTRSYVTPIIRQIGGRTQMILSGSMAVTSYNPDDGSIHWNIDGPTEQFVASIVYNGKLLLMTCGYPERHILAIRPSGRGDVTDTHVVWRTTKAASYVPSPIVADQAGKYFLVAADSGIASLFDSASGQRHWMKRLAPHYSASLVSAGGLVYLLADNGKMTLVRADPQLNIVAENELGQYCIASPAISHGQLFLRSESHLWCIGRK